MKKILVVAIALIATVSSFAQTSQVSYKTTSNPNPFKLEYEKDEFTGKEYLLVLSQLLVSEDGKKGFYINPLVKKNTDGTWGYYTIAGKQVGVGNCNENDKLYIIFEDDTKLQMDGWRDFNCEGKLGFDLAGKQLEQLQKPIKAIKYQNGRTYDSYQKTLTNPNDKNYFINFYKALKEFNEKK